MIKTMKCMKLTAENKQKQFRKLYSYLPYFFSNWTKNCGDCPLLEHEKMDGAGIYGFGYSYQTPKGRARTICIGLLSTEAIHLRKPQILGQEFFCQFG